MDHLLVAMYKAILRKDNKKIPDRICESFRLLGRYVTPSAYCPFIVKAMSNQLASFYAYTAPGSLRAVGHLLAGSIELLQPGQDLKHLDEPLEQIIDTMKVCVIDSLDLETADHMVETLHTFIDCLIKKQSEGVDVSIVQQYLPDFLDFSMRCLSAF